MTEEVIVTHHIHGYIDEKKARKTIEHLNWMDAEYPDSKWEIIISSRGGEMSSGNAIYSALFHFSIRGNGEHYITTKVRGLAGSAASLIFQAGDYRVGGKMDSLFMHEPCLSVEDMPLYQVKETVAHCEKWLELYTDVVLARASMPRGEFLKRLMGHEWLLPIEDAVSYGLADGVA